MSGSQPEVDNSTDYHGEEFAQILWEELRHIQRRRQMRMRSLPPLVERKVLASRRRNNCGRVNQL